MKVNMHSTFPTMSDVAKLAGVSLMTVSRVMNGKCPVSETTRCKVATAVADLGYAPNHNARNLVRYRPIRIGLLYSNRNAGFLSEVLVALIRQSVFYNVELIAKQCEDDVEEGRTRQLIDASFDGIILAPPLCNSGAVIDLAAGTDIPAVAIGCGRPDERVGTICIDDYEGAYRMTSHLILLGHQRIAFIAGPSNRIASMRRLAGYRAAVDANGADRSEELVVQDRKSVV